MHKETIRAAIINLGSVLCGFAPAERFTGAPAGFRPGDIFSRCRTAVVFARQVPAAAAFAESLIPYTLVNNMMTSEVDKLTMTILSYFTTLGVEAVPIPSDEPYEHWEPERQYGRAILSLRHAGWLAGLGILGRNTLLINRQYGNMLQLGAVLIDRELPGDPLVEDFSCPADCNRCLTSCPLQALDGKTVNQLLCRQLSNVKTLKGQVIKKCNTCRIVCPYAQGAGE